MSANPAPEVGARVSHVLWGHGVVTQRLTHKAIEPDGTIALRSQISVRFADSTRSMLWEFAHRNMSVIPTTPDPESEVNRD